MDNDQRYYQHQPKIAQELRETQTAEEQGVKVRAKRKNKNFLKEDPYQDAVVFKKKYKSKPKGKTKSDKSRDRAKDKYNNSFFEEDEEDY